MAKETSAKSWEIGTVRKKNGNTYIVLDKNVKLTHSDGREFDLGEFNTAYINDKTKMNEDLDYKLEQGWITEEQAEKTRETLQEKNIVGNIRLKFKS